MIRIRDLAKRFDSSEGRPVVALGGVTFEVWPGEIFGLLGPNGAGKSTCLRILSTVLRPTGGTAEVAGYDVVRDPAEVRRSIGFLSNNTGLYDRMSAWELVEHFGRLYGLEGRALDRRMAETFELLRMTDFRDTLCSTMSTGQRQKVSIARALVHDPPVLIFDEPTAGLDVLVARAVLKTVADLRDAGKCVIFSTHIMREVEKLCDRVAVIHRGRILDQGPLPELAARHDEPDTEELFFKLIERDDARHAAADPAGRPDAGGPDAPRPAPHPLAA